MNSQINWIRAGVVALLLIATLMTGFMLGTVLTGRGVLQAADTNAAQTTEENTIVVFGEGHIKVKPDIASINLGVVTEANTAQAAVDQNATQMSAVIDKIAALGISQDAIKTTGLSIYPIYSSNDTEMRKITGYRAQNMVMVTVPVAQAAQVFDAGIAAGANQSSTLTFGLKDDSQYRQQALQAAVQAAKSNAETLAKAMNVTIKSSRSVTIGYGGMSSVAPAGAADGKGMSTPIMAGEMEVVAQIQVTYIY